MMKDISSKRVKIAVGAAVVLGILIFLFTFFFKRNVAEVVIERNSYGEGEKEAEVYLENDEVYRFTVEEREYSKEELEVAFSDGFRWAREQMLLDNTCASEVRSNLNFMSEVPGGIMAEWISSDEEIIGSDGTVFNEEMEVADRKVVSVSLILSYREEMQMEKIHLIVKGPVLSEKEKKLRNVQEAIEQREKESRQEEVFSLPGTIEGIKIYANPGINPVGIIFVGAAAGLFLAARKKNKEKVLLQKKRKQIEEDYPVFVNKLILYLGAGLNLKGAFQSMADEYVEAKNNEVTGGRYVYEDLFITLNEIKAGASERGAYESFGNRTGEVNYIRLMSLLVQNYQKGNEGLLKALETEEQEAFSRRIERARKAGEEAGTKLLFPMLLLLIVVMVIVMAPAVFQFQNY